MPAATPTRSGSTRPNETHQVDTGFIVFNDRNYPNFERLLARLGVAWQPSTMTFSVSDGRGDFEYNGSSPNGLFAKRAHLVTPWFHRMMADLAPLQPRRARCCCTQDGDGPSLGHWLEQQRFSRPFIDRLIVPQASAVWSADPHQMWSFPARFLAEFFDNHGMLSVRDRPRWRTVRGGSARYVEALTGAVPRPAAAGHPVRSVRRDPDHVLSRPRGGEAERFDEVVLATHSDQALALLPTPPTASTRSWARSPTSANEAVLHTDVRMLPRRRRAWASWNYHLTDQPRTETTVTYHMNRLQSLRRRGEFCVTLNRTDRDRPRAVIRTIDYSHPVYTAAGVRAQARFRRSARAARTHFCGAYWGWGFHEDGVVSALRVAEQFGARL